MDDMITEMENIEFNLRTEGVTGYLTILISLQECSLTLNGKRYHFPSGNIILCREKIVYQATKPIDVLIYPRTMFDSLFYTQIAECGMFYDFLQQKEQNGAYLYFYCCDDAQVLSALRQIRNEEACRDASHYKMLHLTLIQLLTWLNRNAGIELIIQNSRTQQGRSFSRILNYMGENYPSCTLQKTAEYFGYNPDYLSSRFKKIMGVSFTQKLAMIRLQQAAQLLRTSDETIEQIAQTVGMTNRSYFMRRFRKMFNMTPAQYRKKHQNTL